MQLPKEENSSVEKGNIQDSKKNMNAEEVKEQTDTIKDIASPTTTDDSDASAKSGMENDGDEFKVKKNDDTIEKDKPKIEDDLFDIEDTDDYLLYLEDTLKNIHSAYYKAYDQMKGNGKTPDLKVVIPSVKRLSLKGFIVMDFEDRKHEAEKQLMEWIDNKQIKPAEDIIIGLENTPSALIGLLNGENKGKRMVKLIK